MSYDTKGELEAGIVEYLMFCDRNQTVARVGELALFLQVNRHTLSAMSRRLFNLPTKAALTACQLAKVAGLLRETRVSIEEVAAQAGFGNRRSFHRVFRRRYGCSPQVFRKG
jgi:AraC family transcriptional regulator